MTGTVLKIGGSLLDMPDIVDRILTVADQCSDSKLLVVTGGGVAADLVRNFDDRFGMSDELAHELAIHAMSLNARLLAAVHSRFVLTCSWATSESVGGTVRIVEPVQLLEKLSVPSSAALPSSWCVTSDSIAAWIAQETKARRLILAKSTGLPKSGDQVVDRPTRLAEMATLGLVDNYLPEVAHSIEQIDWVNLRDHNPVIRSLW